MAESGGEFLGRGSLPLLHQLRGLGNAVSFPSVVRVGTPAAQRFCYILSALDGVSCCILGFLH